MVLSLSTVRILNVLSVVQCGHCLTLSSDWRQVGRDISDVAPARRWKGNSITNRRWAGSVMNRIQLIDWLSKKRTCQYYRLYAESQWYDRKRLDRLRVAKLRRL